MGEWKAGAPHGKGLESFLTGEKYHGDFIDGKKQGIGKYVW